MDPSTSRAASPGRAGLAVSVVLLLLWPFGPWLGFFGFVTGLSLFGESPSSEEQSQGALLMLAGAAISWGFPALVLALSGGRRWVRRVAVLELVAATVGVVVALWLGSF